MRLVNADAIYQWYTDAFDFSPNEIRFSMNDIRDNLYNIPTVDAVPRELYESMEATCYKLQQALSESWIPCSERLPEISGWYLVTNDGNTEISVWSCDLRRWGFNDKVTAWMPFPDPYGGDSE